MTVPGPHVAPHEAEDDPQRRRLARAVRPEEAGDRALAHLEAQVVDGDGLPEPLREVVDFDQVSGVT